MANFGELVLVLGDLHLPHRAAAIPPKFMRMLVPNKMQHVLCTGNLTSKDRHDHLRDLAPNVSVVRGDFDEADSAFPERKTVRIGDFKIGLIHGHQVIPWGDEESLGMLAREMDVDILVSGHTHNNTVKQKDGKWFINPGSITGAFSPLANGGSGEVTPSFILLAVQGSKVVCFCYELSKEGEVEVSKTEFTKG